MDFDDFHAPVESLRPETIEMHQAIASLIKELEAVDWYTQRFDANEDEALRTVLAHNRDEEKEHACMTLEWIRRRDSSFDKLLREILFQGGTIPEQRNSGRVPPELYPRAVRMRGLRLEAAQMERHREGRQRIGGEDLARCARNHDLASEQHRRASRSQ